MTRYTVRVQLDPEGKEALDALCQLRGMTQIAVMSRLVKWFFKQDELIQASVLGLLSDESQRELARRLLQRLADGERGSKPPA